MLLRMRSPLGIARALKTRPTTSMTRAKKTFNEEAIYKCDVGNKGLVDIGANLIDDAFGQDLTQVLARAQGAQVKAIVITGTSVQQSRDALELASSKATDELKLWATVGVHPHHAKECTEDTFEELRQLALHPKCVAIGECGLDFDRNFSPQDVQKEVVERQIQLAKELGKPLFMHCREAAGELCDIIERNSPLGVEGVVHCFTGTVEEMQRFVDLGMHIGITGWICDDREGRSEQLSEVVREIPRGRLMIETDAPYLTPRSIKPNRIRPWRNEPCLLSHVLAKIASARVESEAEVALHTTDTALKFFGMN